MDECLDEFIRLWLFVDYDIKLKTSIMFNIWVILLIYWNMKILLILIEDKIMISYHFREVKIDRDLALLSKLDIF